MTRDTDTWRVYNVYLVIVTHGLDCHAEHLVGQGVTARVHDLLDDVDDHVHLLDGLVPEHVGVGGDVVGQVGAVARLQGDALAVHVKL